MLQGMNLELWDFPLPTLFPQHLNTRETIPLTFKSRDLERRGHNPLTYQPYYLRTCSLILKTLLRLFEGPDYLLHSTLTLYTLSTRRSQVTVNQVNRENSKVIRTSKPLFEVLVTCEKSNTKPWTWGESSLCHQPMNHTISTQIHEGGPLQDLETVTFARAGRSFILLLTTWL